MNTTHGHTIGGKKTIVYRVWDSMIRRCNYKKHADYKYYGGRGIKVCKRWLKFENFYADMGDKPEGMSLDRINNDKNYTPKNCRWATNREQSRNTSRNRFITFRGETKCLRDWADELGICPGGIRSRLNYGWSLRRALLTPPQKRAKIAALSASTTGRG